MRFNWKTIAPLVVWLVIYLLPIPAGLNANQWRYFAVSAIQRPSVPRSSMSRVMLSSQRLYPRS